MDPATLTRELERYAAAGLGGVHIIPIYGARGYEARARPYLGADWMDALRHVLREAARLGLGVDMTTGTGWCFGGPMITAELAAARLVTDVRDAPPGAVLHAKYDVSRLDALVAVSADGRRESLLHRVAPDGSLAWTPPAGTWRVYALSSRPSIKVKRAAPGGEGWMLDPYSPAAMRAFLAPFDAAFGSAGEPHPRAMYHDSFEYGADWSRGLLGAFARRRGYRLEDEIGAFVDGLPADRAARVKHDYRETLDELLVDDTFPLWIAWSTAHGMITRNEAHGAPANLLDFYALADVPETEMFRADRDPRVSRLASSAAHVAGRRLVSAETGTWLAEHFHETLAGLKDLVDQLFVAGVNHVVYHGTAYSPDEAAWPGWIFYASTQMNPRNAIWHDVPALNAYIARVQSILQSGTPDNDALVYWPIHDLWHDARGTAIPLTVHAPAWLEEQPVGDVARRLDAAGITYDFVSDRQLAGAVTRESRIVVPGGSYALVIVPRSTFMPAATMAALLKLARDGATVAFDGALPADVAGLSHLEERRAELARLRSGIRLEPASDPGVEAARVGSGRVLVGTLERMVATLPREQFAGLGLEFIRRRGDDGVRHYFVANRGSRNVRRWVRLGTPASRVLVMDPMSGATGAATLRRTGGASEVYIVLAPGESIVLRTFPSGATTSSPYPWWRASGPGTSIRGPWSLHFLEGGPETPAPRMGVPLGSWTDLPDPRAAAFVGTAVYRAAFDVPDPAVHAWVLDLGAARESARVRVNGRARGTLLGPVYRIALDDLRPRGNVIEVEVTSVSANRLRDLARRGVEWRVFHDINVVNLDYQPLDASRWDVVPAGLLGPVTISPASVDTGGE